MLDPKNVPGALAAESDPESVSLARRRVAGLLALFGGGALASACRGEDPTDALLPSAQAAAAITGGAVPNLIIVDSVAGDLLGSPSAVARTGSSSLEVVLAAGYHSKGDGGGGLFMWRTSDVPTGAVSASADGWDDGILVVPFVDPIGGGTPKVRSTNGCWERIHEGPFNVKWFGARGAAGATDDAPAIQNAIWRCGHFQHVAGGAGDVYFPPGTYTVKGEISVSQGQIRLRGSGYLTSRIYYQCPEETPTDVTIFTFLNADIAGPTSGYHPNNRLVGACVRDLSFVSESSTAGVRKTAIALLNTDRAVVEDVQVGPGWTTTGTGYGNVSVGIQVVAGQINKINRVSINADRPIWVPKFPAGLGIGIATCDHLHLSDLSLGPKSDQASVTIEDDVVVANLLIDGNNSFNGGRWGIYWLCTLTQTNQHVNISLNNIRMEGLDEVAGSGYPTAAGADTGCMIYIRSFSAAAGGGMPAKYATAVNGLRIVNVSGPGGDFHAAGFRLNNVLYGRIESCLTGTDGAAVDATGSFIECVTTNFGASGSMVGAMRDLRWRIPLANNATSTLTGVVPLSFFKTATISVSGIYETGSSGTTICEAGVWQATKYGVRKVSGTPKTADVVTTDTFSLVFSSGALVLRNDLTATCTLDCTIVFEHTS